MSLVLTITVTNSKLSATTLPPRAGTTTASTMASADRAVQDLRDDVLRKFQNLLQAADPQASANTTATVTIA